MIKLYYHAEKYILVVITRHNNPMNSENKESSENK